MMAKKLTELLLGSPVIELDHDDDSIDTYSLCGSKHEAWIYVTDEDGTGTPIAGEDSIIVAFTGTDSSGAGCVDEVFETLLDVASGGIKIFTDPVDWYSTVTTGFGEALAREGSPIGRGSIVGDAAVDSGFAQGYVDVIDWAFGGSDDDASTCYITTAVMKAQGHDRSPELNSMRRLRDSYGIWFAESEVAEYYRIAPKIVEGIERRAESDRIYRRLYADYILPAHQQVRKGNLSGAHRIYRSMVSQAQQYASEDRTYRSEVTTCKFWDSSKPEGSFLGTVYHNQNGGEHKVKITINKLYQGKTTTVYQTELAGGEEYTLEDGKLLFEPAYRKFKLTGPGTYTVKVESLAANMDCGNPKLSMTTTIDVAPSPDAGENIVEGALSTFNEGVSNVTEATGVRPLYLYGGIVLVGGLLVSRYLDLFTGGRSE